MLQSSFGLITSGNEEVRDEVFAGAQLWQSREVIFTNCHHEEGEQGSRQAPLLRLLGQFSPTRDLLFRSVKPIRKDGRWLESGRGPSTPDRKRRDPALRMTLLIDSHL
jgi:hypothetical protein